MANPYFTTAVIKDKEFVKSSSGKEPSLLKVTIKMIEPDIKPFRPGQFVTFRVAEGMFRAYSIASDYKNFEEYEFLISCGHEGIGANFFRNIQVGEKVNFLGPNGHFKIIVPVAKELFFFATGTGISPFIPMLEFLMDNNCDTKIHLIHGFRDESNLEFYKSVHSNLKERCPNFKSEIYISKPETTNSEFKKGRITDFIKSLKIEEIKDSQVYLCGHPEMIEESVEFLINAHFPQENIMYEAFTSPGAHEKIN